MRAVMLVVVAIVCLIVGFIAGFGTAVVSGKALETAASPPEAVEVAIDAPSSVAVGEEFTVVVRVKDHLGQARRVGDIDFSTEFLGGFEVVSVDPAPNSSTVMMGYYVYTMNQMVDAGAERAFTFRLKGRAPGVYSGTCDVYVDSDVRYLSSGVAVVVTAASPAPSPGTNAPGTAAPPASGGG